MTRDGRASLSLSKKSNSTPVAVREKRLKFTPASAIVAPSGKLRPISVAKFISLFRPTLAHLICPFARQASISLPLFASFCKQRPSQVPFKIKSVMCSQDARLGRWQNESPLVLSSRSRAVHQVSQRHESQPQRIRARYDKAVPTVRAAPLQAAYGRALSETSYESRP